MEHCSASKRPWHLGSSPSLQLSHSWPPDPLAVDVEQTSSLQNPSASRNRPSDIFAHHYGLPGYFCACSSLAASAAPSYLSLTASVSFRHCSPKILERSAWVGLAAPSGILARSCTIWSERYRIHALGGRGTLTGATCAASFGEVSRAARPLDGGLRLVSL